MRRWCSKMFKSTFHSIYYSVKQKTLNCARKYIYIYIHRWALEVICPLVILLCVSPYSMCVIILLRHRYTSNYNATTAIFTDNFAVVKIVCGRCAISNFFRSDNNRAPKPFLMPIMCNANITTSTGADNVEYNNTIGCPSCCIIFVIGPSAPPLRI